MLRFQNSDVNRIPKIVQFVEQFKRNCERQENDEVENWAGEYPGMSEIMNSEQGRSFAR